MDAGRRDTGELPGRGKRYLARLPAGARRATRDFADWPVSRGDTKRQWVTFLMLLDVADGLRPVAGRVQESGLGWSWDSLVRGGDAKGALGLDWCREAALVSFRHPYTVYRRRGKAWRLPGQIKHAELSEAAKEAFHELAFRHLEAHHAKCLTFAVGRFERRQRDWDQRNTPHAARDIPALQTLDCGWYARGTRVPQSERVLGIPHEAGSATAILGTRFRHRGWARRRQRGTCRSGLR